MDARMLVVEFKYRQRPLVSRVRRHLRLRVFTAARLSTPEDAAAPTLALLPQDGAEKGVPEVLVVAEAVGKEEDRIPK